MAENEVMDEEYEAEYVTLTMEDGSEVDFEICADVQWNGRSFAILQPVEEMEGVEEDEAFVFEVTEDEDGESFAYVDDEETVDAVFAEYDKLFDEE
ncbi:MAG: DUF1292 domain-containing protein [Christensenellaceae bacterium]